MNLTFDEQEREAYQSGDTERAALLAQVSDVEDMELTIDTLRDVIGGIEERITEANWRTGKKAELRELIETIISELKESKS